MLELEKVRKEKRITQSDMARMLNIGLSTYNQYENSNRSIPREMAEKIALILEVDVNDIFLASRFTVSKAKKEVI